MPSINTRTSLLKSAKASSLFFFLCICTEGIGKSFKPKTRLSLLNLNSQRVFKNHQYFMVSKSNFEHFLRHVFPMRYNSESFEVYVVISGNVLLFKDIKISLGLLITSGRMHAQFRENRFFEMSTTTSLCCRTQNYMQILVLSPFSSFSFFLSFNAIKAESGKMPV